MKNNLDIACDSFAMVMTAMQPDELLRIISLILTSISILMGIVYRVWHWYHEAKKDGKIDSEEIKDLVDIVGNGVEQVKDKLKEKE